MINTVEQTEWQVSNAGLFTTTNGSHMIVDTPKGKYVLLTMVRGDVAKIDSFDTLVEAMAGVS